jgi:hypothetical protein
MIAEFAANQIVFPTDYPFLWATALVGGRRGTGSSGQPSFPYFETAAHTPRTSGLEEQGDGLLIAGNAVDVAPPINHSVPGV